MEHVKKRDLFEPGRFICPSDKGHFPINLHAVEGDLEDNTE
jgi:hypothetical protein